MDCHHIANTCSVSASHTKNLMLLQMENSTRKDILIDGCASIIGLVLALYSLVTLKEPTALKWITAIAGVGVFLYGSIRYGIRFRKLQKQKASLK